MLFIHIGEGAKFLGVVGRQRFRFSHSKLFGPLYPNPTQPPSKRKASWTVLSPKLVLGAFALVHTLRIKLKEALTS